MFADSRKLIGDLLEKEKWELHSEVFIQNPWENTIEIIKATTREIQDKRTIPRALNLGSLEPAGSRFKRSPSSEKGTPTPQSRG